MKRRGFFKLMGAAGAGVALGANTHGVEVPKVRKEPDNDQIIVHGIPKGSRVAVVNLTHARYWQWDKVNGGEFIFYGAIPDVEYQINILHTDYVHMALSDCRAGGTYVVVPQIDRSYTT